MIIETSKTAITITLKGESSLLGKLAHCLDRVREFPTMLLVENGEVKEVELLHPDQYVLLAGTERDITHVTKYSTGTVQITTRIAPPEGPKVVRGG